MSLGITPSEDLVEFIKSEEGFSDKPYVDPVGNVTIGFGNTDVKVDSVDPTMAEANLKNHLTKLSESVSRRITRSDLTPSQQDVILDMAYNIGEDKLIKNGFFDLVNSGRDDEVFESIGKYRLATDNRKGSPTFGQKIPLPGLEKRALKRQNLWKQGLTEDETDDALLDEVLSSSEPVQAEQTPEQGDDALLDELLGDDKETSKPNNIINKIGTVSSDEVDFEEQVERLTKEMNIPKTEAQILLSDSNYEDAKLTVESSRIVNNFTTIPQWVGNPTNNYVLAKHTDEIKNLELATKKYRPFNARKESMSYSEDIGIALTRSNLFYEKIGPLSQLLFVGVDEENINKLMNTQDKILSLPTYTVDEELREVQSQLAESGKQLEEPIQKYSELHKMEDGDWKQANERLLNYINSKSTAGRDAVTDALKVMITNPSATAVMGAESATSAIAPIVSGFAGGLLGGPIGFGVGSFLSGSAIAFFQYVDEQSQNFADPETGVIDYHKMFSDRATVRKIREAATVYGVTMGSLEALQLGKAGQYITKPISRKGLKNAVKIVGEKGKDVAKDVAFQSVSEGVQEATAKTAAKGYRSLVYGEEFQAKDVSEITTDAIVESITGIPMAGLSSLAGAAYRGLRNMHEYSFGEKSKKAFKMTGEVVVEKGEKAGKAVKFFNRLTKVREAMQESEAVNKYKGSVKDLIKKSFNNEKEVSPETQVDQYDGTTDIQDIPNEVINEELNNPPPIPEEVVVVNAKTLAEATNKSGIDIDTILNELPPEVKQEYVKALRSNGDIKISVGDWMIATADNPDLDALVFEEDSDMSVIDAMETIDEMDAYFSELGALESKGPTFQEVEPSKEDKGVDEPTLKEVFLYSEFRNTEEREVYNQIDKAFTKMLRNAKSITPAQRKHMAMFQFRHMRFRAEVAGKNLQEYLDTINFGEMTRENYKNFDKALGVFRRSSILARIWDVLIRRDSQLNAVLHELGHSWLYEMSVDKQFIFSIKEENLTPEQRKYKDAILMLEDMLGIEDLSDLESTKISAEERKRIHETFAQTTERYFMDGDVEGNPFRKVMELFRGWLTRIAEYVGTAYADEGIYPLDINPNVKRVFRTLLDIEADANKYIAPAFPTSTIPDNILGARTKEFQEAYKDGLDKAIAEVFGKAYERTYRQAEREYNRKLDNILERATEQIDNLPAMKMLANFRNAYALWKENGKEGVDPRISFDSLVAQGFNGDLEAAKEFKKKLDKNLVTGQKKSGQDFNTVMAAYGILDPSVMIDALELASRRESLIEEQADIIFDAENPTMKSKKEIRRIAEEAANKYGRDKILRKEIDFLMKDNPTVFRNAIAKMAGGSNGLINLDNRDLITDRAKQIVSNEKAGAFKSKNLLNTANKHAKRSGRLFAKGDMIAATEAKVFEAVYFKAFEIAYKMEKDVAKARALFKRFKVLKPQSIARTHNQDLIDYAKVLSDRFQNGELQMPTLTKDQAEAAGLEDGKLFTIKAMIEVYNESVVDTKSRIDMKISSYMYLAEILETLTSLAKKQRDIKIKGQNLFASQVAQGMAKELSKGKKISFGDIAFEITNVRTILSSMLEKAGAPESVTIAVMDMISEAEAALQDALTDSKDKISKAVRKAFKNEKDKGLKKIWAPVVRRINDGPFNALLPEGIRGTVVEPIASKELGVTFNNLGEVLVFFLYMGSESSAQAILENGIVGKNQSLTNLNPALGLFDESPVWAFFERLAQEGKITKDHVEVMNTIWESFEGIFNKVSAVTKDIDGINMGYVEGRVIKTSVGDLRGQYVPLMRSKSKAQQVSDDKTFEANTDGDVVGSLHPFQNLGFTRNRSTRNEVLSLDLSQVTYHLANQYKVAYLRKPMHLLGKILKDPALRQVLESKNEDIYGKLLAPWYRRVLAQEHTNRAEYGILDATMAFFKRNMYRIAFMFKPLVVIKQFIGGSPAIAEIGLGRVAEAYQIMATSPLENRKKVEEKSKRMRVRFRMNEKNNIKTIEYLETNSDWITATGEISDIATFLPMQFAQNILDSALWLAAYQKMIDEGKDESVSRRYADNIVETTQGSANVSDLQKARYGSEFKKIFSQMFSMVPISQFGIMYQAFRRRGFDDPQSKYFVTAFITAALLPAMLSMGATELWDSLFGDDEEKRKRKQDNPQKYKRDMYKRMAQRVASEVIETSLPVVGKFFSAPLGNDITPMSRVFRSGKRAVNAIDRKVFDDVPMTLREAQAVSDLLTLITGLPFPIIVKEGLKLSDVFKSDYAKEIEDMERREALERLRSEENR